MDEPELEQRVEEIELALSGVFESPKAPAISSYDEGTRLFVQVSWVIDSHRDSTLDARCVVTLAFTHAQFERYAGLDTARRKAFQTRLGEWVRKQFDERQTPLAWRGDCAVEIDVPDELF
ncbi:hypothetical protein CIC12_29805 [Burkholderia sp. SG-MS1]|uniref:DUF3022 domain-containing protein n=1 Tax=Paraburkholderia sp. SG-MS1 TaxID=2023741 RepID=UPI00144664C7|nr:DUF3022 domain-containing protein [Paraburkholderia sp. SG-MS1]NKJ50844.1 hypothetical protein [Paraburkholderia sp. SG-MS1]